MKKSLFAVSLLSISSLLLLGCEKPPVEMVAASQAALESANSSEASQYAPEAWAESQKAMAAANAEVEAQAAKLAPFRSYKVAQELVAKARTQAEVAKTTAEAGKLKLTDEAQSAIHAAEAAVAQTSTLLTELEACPKKPKGFETDVEILKSSLSALESALMEPRNKLAAADFSGATAAAQAVAQQAGVLAADLQAAKIKLRC